MFCGSLSFDQCCFEGQREAANILQCQYSFEENKARCGTQKMNAVRLERSLFTSLCVAQAHVFSWRRKAQTQQTRKTLCNLFIS